jgi:hypothetical protein
MTALDAQIGCIANRLLANSVCFGATLPNIGAVMVQDGDVLRRIAARLCALEALAATMATILHRRELSGPLPDHAPILATIDTEGGPGVVVTAGMIRRAG